MTAGLPRAGGIVAASDRPDDTIALDYDGRFVRRKRMVSDGGREFLVDLPETVSLSEGQALSLDDGTTIAVRAAPEALLEITGDDLLRLAWHIGNRHTPCQIAPGRLLIREDHVLARMLEGLGAHVHRIAAPFHPEGGAYGHGRTLGHSHPHDHDSADG